MSDCIFCKIVSKEIPAKIIYEDQDCLAFHDINPAAPVHFLIIPKAHIVSLYEVDDAHQLILGKMLFLAPKLAKQEGCEDGFRTIINTGRVGGQEVFHLHIHVIGSRSVLPAMIHRSQ